MSAVIIGIEGTMLLAQEAALLHRPFCAGVILFSRNYSSPAQLKRLCATIRAQRPDALICVDHEGGRVQRFRDGFTAIPAMGAFGRCFDRRPLLACELAEAAGVVIAYELRQFGIDFSFTPVLDLQDPASGVIGDRAFHANPAVVVLLADALRRGLRTAGMIAVGKHYPGHGRVVGDSHHTLPQDPRDADERESDRYPFIRQIESGIEALMPAHIVFPQTDHRPASFSPVHLAELRALGFDGAIISDDLDMAGALGITDPAKRIQAALDAGADVTLMCNNFAAIRQVLTRRYFHRDADASARRLAALRGQPFDAAALEPAYHAAQEKLRTHAAQLL